MFVEIAGHLLRAHPEAVTLLWGIGRSAAPGLTDRLAQVEVPVLLVYGAEDVLAPRAAMAELAERLPRSRLVEIAEAGHVPIMTRPREVAAAIESSFGGTARRGDQRA